jgi:hypothetical protein
MLSFFLHLQARTHPEGGEKENLWILDEFKNTRGMIKGLK